MTIKNRCITLTDLAGMIKYSNLPKEENKATRTTDKDKLT